MYRWNNDEEVYDLFFSSGSRGMRWVCISSHLLTCYLPCPSYPLYLVAVITINE
jgi:hypothetical protein